MFDLELNYNKLLKAIETLKMKGAECVILGCTKIPLIITQENWVR